MALYKNDFPILEYDDNKIAIIQPDEECPDIKLPRKAVFAFVGEKTIQNIVDKFNGKIVTYFSSVCKSLPIYIISYENEEICICEALVGSALSTQILDFLIFHGVEVIMSTGSCGVLVNINENEFIIPIKALRDEGVSYKYLPAKRFIDINSEMINNIKKTLLELKIKYKECITWTTDGFFRETKDMVNYRKNEGCEVVEMECSALASCAKFRNVLFGQLLFTADSLADIENYNPRDFGVDSREIATTICLKILKNII